MWFGITELHVSEKPQKLPGGIGLLEFLLWQCSVSPPLGSYHRQRALWLTLIRQIGDFSHKGLKSTHCVGTATSFSDWNGHISPASSLVAVWYVLNVYYMAGTRRVHFHMAASNFHNLGSCSQRSHLLKWWNLSTDNLTMPKITKRGSWERIRN